MTTPTLITGPASGVTSPAGEAIGYRPIRPDDEDRPARFHSRLSPETVYLRYFSADPRLSSAELLRALVPVALRNGVRCFVAETMVGNHKMPGVFRRCGYREGVSFNGGLFHVVLELTGGGEADNSDHGGEDDG